MKKLYFLKRIMPLCLLVIGLWVLPAGMQVQAQETATATGMVTDEDGKPVVGVSVVYGTQGVMTGPDGRFSLPRVPQGATLKFSFLGMVTVEAVFNGGAMNITMKDDAVSMDEVIVVAFGEQARSTFTGSASVITSDQLATKSVSNVMDALVGEVAGMQMARSSGNPTSNSSVHVRGLTSMSSNVTTTPLVVIDGVSYENSINSLDNINPADIESITVLKDAASTSLYGARAANGVILVTTKKATSGEAIISFDAKFGVSKIRKEDQYDYITDPGEYYEFYYTGLYNYYADGEQLSSYEAHRKASQTLFAKPQDGGLGYQSMSVPAGQFLIGDNGRLNPLARLGYVTESGYTIRPDDWFKEAYRTGLRQEYNLSVSGGSEKLQVYTSFGYLDLQGIVDGSDQKRFTGRINANYQARKWLKMGVNVNITNRKENDPSSSVFSMVERMAPIYPVYLRDAAGNIMMDDRGKMYDYGNNTVPGLIRYQNSESNYLQTNALNLDEKHYTTMTGSAFFEFQLAENLKFKIDGTMSERENRSNSTSQPWYGNPTPGGYVSVSHARRLSFASTQLLNYFKSFGDHNLAVLLGHEYTTRTDYNLSGSRTGMFNFFDNTELGGAITLSNNGSSRSTYNAEGFFSRVNYDYKGRYVAHASYRRDGSSRFHPDHRWGNFYSVSAAWVMSREEWFRVSWVDMLKPRFSYGQVGNDQVGTHQYEDRYSLVNNDGEMALTFSSKGNKNITWETNTSAAAGIDFSVFNGRVSGSLDYYWKKTTNMLTSVSVPLSAGYSTYPANDGNMVNQGIEVDLKGTILRTRDFRWNMNVNAAFNRNKLTYLPEERKTVFLEGYWGNYSGHYFKGEGLSTNTFRLRRFAGISDEGLPMWYQTQEDGTIITTSNASNATEYMCGNSEAAFLGGFGMAFSYKGFNLSFNAGYSIGGKVYDSAYNNAMAIPEWGKTGRNIHKDLLEAWTPENPSDRIPRWRFNDINIADLTVTSDYWLRNASYLDINNIILSYTFPKEIARKVGLQNLRVNVSCDNVYFWSTRKGLRPNQSFDGSTSSSSYPMSRTITGGLSLRF